MTCCMIIYLRMRIQKRLMGMTTIKLKKIPYKPFFGRFIVAGIALYIGAKVLKIISWQIWALRQFEFNNNQIKYILEKGG